MVTKTRARVRRAVARQRLREDMPRQLILVWLPTLMRVDPELGVSVMEERLQTVELGKHSEAVSCFAGLFGDLHDEIDLNDSRSSRRSCSCACSASRIAMFGRKTMRTARAPFLPTCEITPNAHATRS